MPKAYYPSQASRPHGTHSEVVRASLRSGIFVGCRVGPKKASGGDAQFERADRGVDRLRG